jgi:transcriptional regulator with PAS, ATPase and Fis domain
MDTAGVGQGSMFLPKRKVDRRVGLHDLVREVATDWVANSGPRDVSTMMLARLRRLLAAKNVQLSELPGDPPLRVGHPVRGVDHVAFAVPTCQPGKRIVLEAALEAPGLDDWGCQLLEAVASLATIVIEAERLARVTDGIRPRSVDGAAPLIGSSAIMHALRDRVERVATTDFTVLIEGESGTGKELVARQIHELSRRRGGPFVAINCAALVESLFEAELFGIEERTATGVRGRRGKFEHADGGTLFLDEVSELSVAAQAKLLRAIQDLSVERVGGVGVRRVDTRIVVATNRSLVSLCDKALFRTDLYYRLSGVDVRVPPLRQRKDDIMELAQYFLSRHNGRRRLSISPAAADALKTYDWPGNVRELERMIEGAVATCDGSEIGLDDLPIALRGAYGEVLMPSVQADDTMRAWGSRYARLILERSDRNKRRACKALGISYHTLNAYLNYRGKTPERGAVLPPHQVPATAAEVISAPSEMHLR